MQMKHLVVSLRPKQWTKNLIILLPLAFTLNLYWDFAHRASAVDFLGRSLLAVVFFSLLSSGVYLVNDIADLESDRNHPTKRLRPLAAGAIDISLGVTAAAILLGGSIAASFALSLNLGLVALAYATLMLAYSFYLKHVVILDVGVIAAGFVIRVIAGAFVIDVPVSPWLYICTILGALFIGFSKRRNELMVLEASDAGSHRGTLNEYTLPLLDQLIAVVAPATLVAYSLYTATAAVPREMMVTVPFILYGIFRYLYLVHSKNLGGSPEDILLTDRPLLANIALWMLTAGTVLLVFR